MDNYAIASIICFVIGSVLILAGEGKEMAGCIYAFFGLIFIVMDSEKYWEKVVVFNKDFSDGEILDWAKAEELGHDIDGFIKVCVTDEFKTWK